MRIQSQELSDRLILSAVGALQGFVVWLLLDVREQNLTTATFAALLTLLLVSAAIVHFAWTGRQNPRLIVIASAVGVVYAAIAMWVALQLPADTEASIFGRGDQARVVSWIIASFFSLYVLGPFLQIYQRTSTVRFPYTDLFVYSWSNFHIALVGLLFVGVLWAVLGLWAALFKLLGIDFFADLFTEEVFMWTVTGGAVGFGLSLGREKEKLIATLRNITLSVFRALLPLVAGVALMFLIAIPFTGLDTLWDTRRASWILLSWVAYTVLFINAVYQDGTEPPPYPQPIRLVVEGGLVAMIVFGFLALFGLFMRIDQYGLTPTRFRGLIFAMILGLYVIGYSASVVRRRAEWIGSIRAVNLWMAPVLVVVALLLHTPVLDPLNWSAGNQYNRLASGKADAKDFDYAYLRFKLGRAGHRRFDDMQALTDHPQAAEIRAGVNAAKDEQFYERRRAVKSDEREFKLYPVGSEWPPGLLLAIRNTVPNYAMARTQIEQRDAIVFAIDLDDAAGAEYLVFPPLNRYEAFAFKSTGTGSWTRFAMYRTAPGRQDFAKFDDDVAAGNIHAVSPEYPDVQIGEQRFYPAPHRRSGFQPREHQEIAAGSRSYDALE